MNTLKIFLSFVLLSSFTKVQGQKFEGDFLTVNLLKPIDFSVPRFNAGYLKRINEQYAVGLNLGYGNEDIAFFKNSEFPKIDYQFREISLEVYKFFESSKTLTEYVSLEAHYLNHKETRIDEFYSPNDDTFLQFDEANYERNKFALNIKFGILARLKNSIGINGYVGIGARVRDNSFENVINAREPSSIDDDGGYPIDFVAAFDNTYEKEGAALGLNITFGANIVLQLKKAPD